jgi:cytochrome c oxidase subunit 4
MSNAHHPSLGVYFTIFGALLVLTAVTVWVAYADLGPLAGVVAVAIATVKATLVTLYFMHVRYETRLIGLWAAAGVVFFFILVAFTMGEVMARRPLPTSPLGPASRGHETSVEPTFGAPRSFLQPPTSLEPTFHRRCVTAARRAEGARRAALRA